MEKEQSINNNSNDTLKNKKIIWDYVKYSPDDIKEFSKQDKEVLEGLMGLYE